MVKWPLVFAGLLFLALIALAGCEQPQTLTFEDMNFLINTENGTVYYARYIDLWSSGAYLRVYDWTNSGNEKINEQSITLGASSILTIEYIHKRGQGR